MQPQQDETLFDRRPELLEKLERGDIDPSSARVLLDGLKFQMQCDDKRFAERQRQEITGRDGAPLIPQQKEADLFETARGWRMS